MNLLKIKNFIYNNSGATAMEYSLLGVLIAVAMIVGLQATGVETIEMYECVERVYDGEECHTDSTA